jgi:ribosomal-protein-alanine N-acetyltransferase
MAAQPESRPVTVVLKPMVRRHLRAVLAIEEVVYPSGWSRSVFLSELAQLGTREYWVAKCGRTIVGYVGLMLSVDEGHITTIAVHPDWQRLKIATRLLLHAAELTIERGYDALTLEARVSNTAAHALYEQFGFRSVGVRPNYYGDNREDAVVMWVHDLQSPHYRERLDAIAATLPATTAIDRR